MALFARVAFRRAEPSKYSFGTGVNVSFCGGALDSPDFDGPAEVKRYARRTQLEV